METPFKGCGFLPQGLALGNAGVEVMLSILKGTEIRAFCAKRRPTAISPAKTQEDHIESRSSDLKVMVRQRRTIANLMADARELCCL